MDRRSIDRDRPSPPLVPRRVKTIRAATLLAFLTVALVVIPVAGKDWLSDRADPRYASCAEAIAHGHGPYRTGADPEYSWYTDRDHDGIVCER
ncbi:excalibur calcium-binding domain-containing protein [Flindersiella endophytica]